MVIGETEMGICETGMGIGETGNTINFTNPKFQITIHNYGCNLSKNESSCYCTSEKDARLLDARPLKL